MHDVKELTCHPKHQGISKIFLNETLSFTIYVNVETVFKGNTANKSISACFKMEIENHDPQIRLFKV